MHDSNDASHARSSISAVTQAFAPVDAKRRRATYAQRNLDALDLAVTELALADEVRCTVIGDDALSIVTIVWTPYGRHADCKTWDWGVVLGYGRTNAKTFELAVWSGEALCGLAV